ncbi:MAG TPA: hypothetical protein VK631_17760, partial [Solirubrobacteraceae bacterium]|nr:hypothetical protein [Solirubrobacteraceae bacterium]
MQGHRWWASVLVGLVALALAGAALASGGGKLRDRAAAKAPAAVQGAVPHRLAAPARARSTALRRARSRRAYADLTAPRAFAVARRHARPDRLASSLRTPIKRVLQGGRAALVGAGRVTSLVESTLPLVAGPDRRPVDLTLVDAGVTRRPANPLVDVRLPENSTRPATLSSLAVGARLHGARRTGAMEAGGRLFYANALRDTDLVLAPRPAGFEVSAVLRSEHSPDEVVVDLLLPAGTTVRAQRGGGFALKRGTRTVGLISPPVAWDADQRAVPVTAALRGGAMVLAVDHRTRDLRYPVVVDPEFASFDWAVTPSDVAGWTYVGPEFTPSSQTYLGIAAKPTTLVCTDPRAADTVKAHAATPPGCTSVPYEYLAGASAMWTYTAPPNTSIYRADFLGAKHTYQGSCMREGLLPAGSSTWSSGTWTALEAGVGGTSGSSPFTYCAAASSDSKQHCLLASCQPDPARPGQNRVGFQLSLPNGGASNSSTIRLTGARVFVHDFNAPAIASWGHASDPAGWSGDVYRSMNPTLTDPGLGVKRYTLTWPAATT